MLTEQRFEIILQLLEEKKSITVTELKELLDTSESTIRRDLTTLHRKGLLTKVFGGAVVTEQNYSIQEPTVAQKEEINKEEKIQIGSYAATLIHDTDFIYIDAGTTTGHMIDYIKDTKATFVTNAVSHAKKLALDGKRVLLLGGELKGSTEAIIGNQALLMLEHYHFSKGFFGTNGITPETGMTTPDDTEAMIKRMAAMHCKEIFVLADHTKFDQVSAVTFTAFEDATIITDYADENYKKYEHIVVAE